MATVSYLSARYPKGNLPDNVLYYALLKPNKYTRTPSCGIRRPSSYYPHPLPYPQYTNLTLILGVTSWLARNCRRYRWLLYNLEFNLVI
jgi:hypothetical protein